MPVAKNERQAAIEGVKAGEEFAVPYLEVAELAHAGKDHGCIDKGVDPLHSFEMTIANHAAKQRDGDERCRDAETAREPFQEGKPAQQRLVFVLQDR